MYFEDEKDNIDDLQIQPDDEAISWDTIIDTDDDGIVSIKDEKTESKTPVEVFTNEEELPDINSIDLGDGLSVVEDEDEALDEAELAKILNSDDSEIPQEDLTDTENFDTSTQEGISPEEAADQASEDGIVPRKETVENKKQISPVLIALLIALLVAAGSYFIFTMFSNREEEDIPLVNTDAMQQNVDNGAQNPQEQIKDTSIADIDAQIPVVNEEEVGTLKAEEKEEKKQIVNVIPTGRTDPFMPLSKYKYVQKSNVQVINTIDYDSVSIPKAPMKFDKGDLSGTIDKLMSVSVSGIMYDNKKPSAIITYNNDDYFVLVGDMLDKFKIVDIGPSSVKIAYGKNIYTAKVGESFDIKDFYGNIKYKDGGRQYYSSEEEYYSINGISPDNKSGSTSGAGTSSAAQRRGYTSDNDITIKNK